MTFFTHTSEETIELGRKIGAQLVKGDVLAMTGTLAAGKTTLTKGIAQALGVDDNVTSPTFCLISEYEGKKLPLYHMDVYRLEGAEDFANLGVDDMLYGDGVCVVEWSEKVASELPKRAIKITIEPLEGSERKITIDNWNKENIK